MLKNIFIFISLFYCFLGFSQNNIYSKHSNYYLYPFKHVLIKNDSSDYLLQHFYFAVRENNVKKANKLKDLVTNEFITHSLPVNQGVWDFTNAYYYRINGQIDKAILNYNKSKLYFYNKKDTLSALWVELGLANCDYFLNRRDSAFSKYLNLFEKANKFDSQLAANLAFNIAVSYHEKYATSLHEKSKSQNKLKEQALQYYQITLKKNLESHDFLGLTHTYCLLGALNSLMGNKKLANERLDTAMYYAKKIDLVEQIAFVQINKGDLLIQDNKVSLGLISLDKALEYYTKAENHNMCSLAMLRKSTGYEKNKDFENAYRATLERVRYNKLFYSQSLLDKSAFYETEFKTQALKTETLEQQKIITKIENEKLHLENENLYWIIGLVILTFLIILLIVTFSFIIKNKTKKIAIKQQEFELKLQKKMIFDTIALQDEVRLRIGRNVHDGICQTITGIKLNQQFLLNECTEVPVELTKLLKENLTQIDALYKEARNVSHELVPSGISHNSIKNLITDICAKMFRGINFTMNDNNLKEHIFQNKDSEKLHIVRIFQELATNIVKHSFASRVAIQLYERNNQLIIRIEDDGKGMNLSSENTGIGLQSIKYRIEMLKGSLSFENDNGLISVVNIPLAS